MSKREGKVKPFNSGQWTEARKRAFITSALRRASWPVKYECLKVAKLSHKIVNPLSGRKCDAYTCAECGGEFIAKEMRADHIVPIVPVTGFDSWDELIERLFCELSGFQAICIGCHKIKTAEENAQRKENKKNDKA